jgi:hypothetical protein
MAAPTYQFANDADTELAAPINTVVTTLTVSAGTGVLFPTPAANQPFLATLLDAATQTVSEIVLVTARVGDVFTIVRAQEGTTAKTWSGGDIVANLVTAGTAQNMEQIPQAQAAAHNWGQDTGGVNSYVAAYSPPITQRIEGMTLRIKIANSNTGASTLDVGAGPSPWVNPDGSSLGAGALIAGGWSEFVDNVTNYQLISSSQQAQSQSGAFTTGGMQFRPTSETISGWVIANATTIGDVASNATQRANADTANLFAWHWSNFSNTQCPVFTSGGVPTTRGTNAAADFAANKQIQVYDKRGKGDIGVDTMQGGATTRLSGVPVQSGSSTAPGSVVGENLHALITAELAVHSHANTLSDPTHHHTVSSILFNTTDAGTISPLGYFTNSGSAGGVSTDNAATGITLSNANAGSGTAHNTVQLSDAMTYYIKL